MSSKDNKPHATNRDAPAADPVRVTRNNSGRVKFDDRGNAIWEWAVTTGSFGADISTSRLKKLEAPSLALAEEPSRGAKATPKRAAQGYSPYDSGLPAKADRPVAKKKDLRRLGEFIKLREQASRIKRDEE